jgi:hypothetical protein
VPIRINGTRGRSRAKLAHLSQRSRLGCRLSRGVA